MKTSQESQKGGKIKKDYDSALAVGGSQPHSPALKIHEIEPTKKNNGLRSSTASK